MRPCDPGGLMAAAMHLLIVHQNFVDHQHPGGTRHFELARHLVQRGHRCTIVAGSVDFLTGRALPSATHCVEGVVIRRAYAFPTVHHSYLGRALSYLCFMVTSVWQGLRAGGVDVVMGTSPPMFQLPSAWLVAKLRRRPFLLEIRDLWPDFAVDMGLLRSRGLIALARRVEMFFYRHHDWAIINSPGFRTHLEAAGIDPRRLSVVANGVETSMFSPESRGLEIRERLQVSDRFLVTYAGSLGKANDLDTLLRAADDLQDTPEVCVVIVGGGKELPRLRQQVAERKLNNVVFAGHFAKSEMRKVLAATDVCVAILQNRPLFRTVYPNKVFDYMAAGRPTILAIDGVIRDVIEQSDGGTYVPPGNHRELAAAVRKYLSDPALVKRQGQSARRYVEAHFERRIQAAALERVLQRMMSETRRLGLYRTFFKRIIDVTLAATALMVLSPLLIVVYLLVRWQLGAPALFSQTRGGWRGRPFTLYKFRTMREARDERGEPLPDEERLTKFGQTLRSLSLDELPQLWNILRGDMSLIGPRPLLERYLPRYSPQQARRLEVRPGITGWAQVNGRNAVSWNEKFRLDVWYVDHVSLALDLKILWLTLVNVCFRRGIRSEGHATMPEFMGDEPVERSTSLEETVP